MQNIKLGFPKAAFALAALSFLLLSTGAHALGISPARTVVDFSPNLNGHLDFCAINNEHKEIGVELYVKGDLSQYITLSKDKSYFFPSTEQECYSAIYQFPASITPGHHDIRIGVVESTTSDTVGGTGIAARVGVETEFWVEAPFPGKYVTGTILVPEKTQAGQPVAIKMQVKNAGKEDTNVKIVLEVHNPSGDLLTRYEGTAFLLKVGETKEDGFTWTEGKTPGIYKAVAYINYEGVVGTAEKDFTVGGLLVQINKLGVSQVRKGGIQVVPIELESFWNEKIDNVYAELTIKQGGTVIASKIRSDVLNLPPYGAGEVKAFWDTTNVEPGKYTAHVEDFYSTDSTTAADFDIEVVNPTFNFGFASPLLIFIMLDIAVLIAIIVIVMRYLKKQS